MDFGFWEGDIVDFGRVWEGRDTCAQMLVCGCCCCGCCCGSPAMVGVVVDWLGGVDGLVR